MAENVPEGAARLPEVAGNPPAAVADRERSPRRVLAHEQMIYRNGVLKGALTVTRRINAEAAELRRRTEPAEIPGMMTINDDLRVALDRATITNKVLAHVLAAAWTTVDELRP